MAMKNRYAPGAMIGKYQQVEDWNTVGKMKIFFIRRWDYQYSLWAYGYFYNLINEKIITETHYSQENHSINISLFCK